MKLFNLKSYSEEGTEQIVKPKTVFKDFFDLKILSCEFKNENDIGDEKEKKKDNCEYYSHIKYILISSWKWLYYKRGTNKRKIGKIKAEEAKILVENIKKDVKSMLTGINFKIRPMYE